MAVKSTKQKDNRYAVVLAGGAGTRLWPISRESLPKQIQKFMNNQSLLEETIERLSGLVVLDHIYISTTKNYAEQIQKILPNFPHKNIVVEPVGRGTVAALVLATSIILKRDKDAVIVSIASDHAVTETKKFHQTLKEAFEHIINNEGEVCMVGIKPTRADNGLGYIKTKGKVKGSSRIYCVDKFFEKPSIDVARGYVASGSYFWNAAYYCFKASTLREAYLEASPHTVKAVDSYLKNGSRKLFDKLEEKRHEIEIINPNNFRLTLIVGDFLWSDIGNWHALHEALVKVRKLDVVVDGTKHVDIGSKDCFISSQSGKLVATIGLKDLVIVDTPDVILIIDKNKSESIKQIMSLLRERGLHKFL